MRIETELNGKTVGAIERHYLHAKEKHPYFCDALTYHTRFGADFELAKARDALAFDVKNKTVTPLSVLNCETLEVIDAIVHDDKTHAIEECYDAIAVLLRVIDVLEGRQKLGKPETQGEAK
jgi:NTP pyrophosphatase (non-canonical NTP hydrolase)